MYMHTHSCTRARTQTHTHTRLMRVYANAHMCTWIFSHMVFSVAHENVQLCTYTSAATGDLAGWRAWLHTSCSLCRHVCYFSFSLGRNKHNKHCFIAQPHLAAEHERSASLHSYMTLWALVRARTCAQTLRRRARRSCPSGRGRCLTS